MTAANPTSILFVCMGNICRSPTAEGVFRARALAAGLSDLLIDSAGTHGYHVGEPPDPRSQQCAARRGIDLSRQRARQVTAADFARFDRILAMDADNLAALRAICPPQYRHKLALFMQYASRSGAMEVPDPYLGGAGGFELVLDYLEDAADGLVGTLRAGR